MIIGILSMHFDLPSCHSLKEKRSIIRPFCHRLHREFNISIAEMGFLDAHHSSLLAAVKVANERPIIEKEFTVMLNFIEKHFPDLSLIEHSTEYF